MKDKELEDIIDYIIKHVNIDNEFSFIKMITYYSISRKANKQKRLRKEIAEYKVEIIKKLKMEGYIEPGNADLLKLTPKGIQARNMGGHYVYKKQNSPKMTKFEIISLIIAIAAIIISVLPLVLNKDNEEIKDLQKRIEILENKHK